MLVQVRRDTLAESKHIRKKTRVVGETTGWEGWGGVIKGRPSIGTGERGEDREGKLDRGRVWRHGRE